jgi:hypoxanthine phosphoribosyltransferase
MKIILEDKAFEVYLKNSDISERVAEIGEKITRDFQGKELVILGVLNGSFIFLADLCRAINLPLTCSFIKLSSYKGTQSSGEIKSIVGLDQDVKGKHVLIVEDIVDSGLTLDYLIKTLSESNPAQISTATLLYKPVAFRYKYEIDYVGFEIPNKFVVGFGLDYNGLGRNLPDIYQLSTLL